MHHKRRYSTGTAKAVKKKGKGGGYSWELSINEGTPYDTVDEIGGTKTETKWRTIRKRIDVPCRKVGSASYTGRKQAEAELRAWRDSLVSQAEAEHARAVEEAEADSMRERFSYDSMTVKAFLESYVKERELDGLEARTLETYTNSLKRAINFLGGKKVGEVTTDDLRMLNKAMKDRGLSGTTRKRTLGTMKFAWDAHKEQISTYPFGKQACKRFWPKPNKTVPHPLSEEGLAKVLEDLEQSKGDWFMTSVELALRYGLREGEVCGLMWSDVDMDDGTIVVRQSIMTLKGGAECRPKKPKDTAHSEEPRFRVITGCEETVSMLKKRFEHMVDDYAHAHPDKSRAEAEQAVGKMYVTGFVDGRYRNPTILSRTYRGYASRGIYDENGKRATFHGLRDTYASRAITEAHVDPVTLAELLGHKDPAFTLRVYTKPTDDAKRAATKRIGDIYSKKVSNEEE